MNTTKQLERLCFWKGFLIGQFVWLVPLFMLMASKALSGEQQ